MDCIVKLTFKSIIRATLKWQKEGEKMNVEKEFTMSKDEFINPETFTDRIIKYMVNKYQCKKDAAQLMGMHYDLKKSFIVF